MRFVFSLLFVLIVACSNGSKPVSPEVTPPRPELPARDSGTWFLERALYHVDVRSFQDGDGDGIGDLSGLLSRLEHIVELRAGTLVLDPVQPSSYLDGNRAVSDFTAIDTVLGDLADFDAVMDRATELGLRVLLTLPINHTDRYHPRFTAALAATEGTAAQWYRLAASAPADCDDILPAEPDIYGAKRWRAETDAGVVYYHRFAASSPDLNLTHEPVIKELEDTLTFWLDRGVDGFYFPYAYAWVEDGAQCENTTASLDLLTRLRGHVGDDPVLLVADQYPRADFQRDPARTLGYLEAGADLVIDADSTLYTHALAEDGFPTADFLEQLIAGAAPAGDVSQSRRAVLASGLKERPRAASIYGNVGRVYKFMQTIQFSTPLVPLIYYGDEIGISHGTSFLTDVRDLYRPTMAWTVTAPGFGFSDTEPWLSAPQQAAARNVQLQRNDEGSILTTTQRLLDIRHTHAALWRGSFETLTIADQRTGSRLNDVFGWVRRDGGDVVVALHNLANAQRDVQVNLTATGWQGGQALQDLLDADAELAVYAGPDAPAYRISVAPQTSIYLATVTAATN